MVPKGYQTLQAIADSSHEPAHAMHMMNGMWRYFASELQAIEEENTFRNQLAQKLGRTPAQRYRANGISISDLTDASASSRSFFLL